MEDYWVSEDFVNDQLAKRGYDTDTMPHENIKLLQRWITGYGDRGADLATAIDLSFASFRKAQERIRKIAEETGVMPEYIDL